jgi:hypothetical protein
MVKLVEELTRQTLHDLHLTGPEADRILREYAAAMVTAFLQQQSQTTETFCEDFEDLSGRIN